MGDAPGESGSEEEEGEGAAQGGDRVGTGCHG